MCHIKIFIYPRSSIELLNYFLIRHFDLSNIEEGPNRTDKKIKESISLTICINCDINTTSRKNATYPTSKTIQKKGDEKCLIILIYILLRLL